MAGEMHPFGVGAALLQLAQQPALAAHEGQVGVRRAGDGHTTRAWARSADLSAAIHTPDKRRESVI